MSTAPNFETYWPEIKSFAESKKVDDLIQLMDRISDPKERVAFYRFTVRSLMFREWSEKSLDLLILLGDRAIALALQIGEIDEANIINYNMSSNLATCWNDGFHRSQKHHEKGLQYAQKALDFRRELNKGPIPFSLAYWAEGIHHFGLKKYHQAEESFKQSLDFAIKAAQLENQPIGILPETSFFVLIAHGYLALAQLAQGNQAAQQTLTKVLESFEGMKSLSADAKEEAEIGLQQLHHVRSQI